MIWSKGLPEKGEYLLFSWLADDFNGYGPEKGSVFTKRLFCGPGDFLDTTGEQVFCNGDAGRLVAYEMGKKRVKVKPFRYKGIIPKGKYFAVGDIKESYDSLYWGFIDESWIFGRVRFWI
jgi:type IV secretory pathway protease TraF